jgi:organic radical activating enzyme
VKYVDIQKVGDSLQEKGKIWDWIRKKLEQQVRLQKERKSHMEEIDDRLENAKVQIYKLKSRMNKSEKVRTLINILVDKFNTDLKKRCSMENEINGRRK